MEGLSREVTRHIEVVEEFRALQGVTLPGRLNRIQSDEILFSHITTGDRQTRGCQLGSEARKCTFFNSCEGLKACRWDNLNMSPEGHD